MPNVFVYGTLKRGGGLHRYLEDSTFLGEARTHPDFTLYSLGWFPAMVVAREGEKTGVKGEVYDVDPLTLRELDSVEGAYDRILIPLIGPVASAYAYVYRYRLEPRESHHGDEWINAPFPDWSQS